MVSIASVLRESEREEAKANDQEKEVDQIAHGFGPPFKYKCEVGTMPFRPSLILTYDISLRSEFVIFAGSSTSHKIMQTNERYTRRLATLFLGLFLSLLAMVSLHDFSHRADAVQDVVSTEGYTSHVTKTDCSICHFVHTPFLALAIGTLLAAVALGVCLLGVRLVRLAHSIRRDAVQLRAPPSFA